MSASRALRLLRHILDNFFPCQSRSPTVEYDFVFKILNSYEELKKEYNGEADVIVDKNLGWRADFKFLCVGFFVFCVTPKGEDLIV